MHQNAFRGRAPPELPTDAYSAHKSPSWIEEVDVEGGVGWEGREWK